MKIIHHLVLVFSISIIMLLQGCGGSDTSGALTMSALTSVNNNDGTYRVSTKVTYVPPTGKSAQGVEVAISVTDISGVIYTGSNTLTSGSNSFDFSINVPQYTNTSNNASIESKIGGMAASASVTIPKFTFTALAVPAPTADFFITDIANTSRSVVFTGGTSPFSFISSDPNISATISPATNSISGGGVINIVLLTANPAGISTPATVTLLDSVGGAVAITVTYFK